MASRIRFFGKLKHYFGVHDKLNVLGHQSQTEQNYKTYAKTIPKIVFFDFFRNVSLRFLKIKRIVFFVNAPLIMKKVTL